MMMKKTFQWIADMFLTPDPEESGKRPGGMLPLKDRPHVQFRPILEYMKDTAAAPDRVEHLGDGVYAHNHFTVVTSPGDIDRLERNPVLLKHYIHDLEKGITEFYKVQKYKTFGDIQVEFRPEEKYGKGRFHVESDIVSDFQSAPAMDSLKTIHKTVFKTMTPPPGGKLAVLTVLRGTQKDKVFPLMKPSVSLGRIVPGNTPDIGLEDAQGEVSRKHARIEESEEGYTLTDTQSNNGTMLNGKLLAAGTTQPLKSGDRILLAGNVELLFSLKDELSQIEDRA